MRMASTEGMAGFTTTYQGSAETHQTWYKILPGSDNSKKP
jgi:hypothetical protein